MRELARIWPRFGYRRLYVLLREEGTRVNHKRVYRLYREEGLMLRRKRRRKWVRFGAGPKNLPTRPNERWSLDFVSDAAANGQTIRVLAVVDDYTRECLALEVDTSLPGIRVARTLNQIVQQRGRPNGIVLDNGPELRGRALQSWSENEHVPLLFIDPGKPVQNAFIESFNGRLRDECLNANWFLNTADARRRIQAWRKQYNELRPHSSLGYLTPAEFAARKAIPPGQSS
jgi:putative transposase